MSEATGETLPRLTPGMAFVVCRLVAVVIMIEGSLRVVSMLGTWLNLIGGGRWFDVLYVSYVTSMLLLPVAGVVLFVVARRFIRRPTPSMTIECSRCLRRQPPPAPACPGCGRATAVASSERG